MQTQPESAWGPKPPAGHAKTEAEWLRRQLKDPYSADIRPATLSRTVLPASCTDGTVVPVWCSNIAVNAKNSFGAYTGFKTWMFCYSNGSLFATVDGDGIKTWADRSVSSCSGLQRATIDLHRDTERLGF
ncbi:MAG TPA: hypothetical protein VNV16_12445 [Methylibium sp.]|nr:hypothetical protein [Methylibium sp.]